MIYSIRIRNSAAKELRRLPVADRRQVAAAIDRLAHTPREGRVLKGGLRGLRRLRVGRVRVIYEVQDDTLVVLLLRVGSRAHAYRGAIL